MRGKDDKEKEEKEDKGGGSGTSERAKVSADSPDVGALCPCTCGDLGGSCERVRRGKG